MDMDTDMDMDTGKHSDIGTWLNKERYLKIRLGILISFKVYSLMKEFWPPW